MLGAQAFGRGARDFGFTEFDVGKGDSEGVDVALHGGRDVAGDAALIEGRGTVSGDRLESGSEGWVLERVAFRPRVPGGIEKISAGRGGETRRIGLGEKLGEAGGDLKSIARQRDSRCEQLGPRKLAVFVVRELERQQLPSPAPKQRKGATKH